MVIAHNMMAMNAQRQFNIVNDRKAKSTEKLSSGYRINRAADDAAGLSISEKMRRQIRGLNRGAQNTEEGISLLQVADGALAEVTDMLHRITELSIQSANGTNSQSDRDAIQDEIGEIIKEIDRIGDTTKFNETYLFNGYDEAHSVSSDTYLDGMDGMMPDVVSFEVTGIPTDNTPAQYSIKADENGFSIDGKDYLWRDFKTSLGEELEDEPDIGNVYSMQYKGMELSLMINEHNKSLEEIAKNINNASFETYVVSKSTVPVISSVEASGSIINVKTNYTQSNRNINVDTENNLVTISTDYVQMGDHSTELYINYSDDDVFPAGKYTIGAGKKASVNENYVKITVSTEKDLTADEFYSLFDGAVLHDYYNHTYYRSRGDDTSHSLITPTKVGVINELDMEMEDFCDIKPFRENSSLKFTFVNNGGQIALKREDGLLFAFDREGDSAKSGHWYEFTSVQGPSAALGTYLYLYGILDSDWESKVDSGNYYIEYNAVDEKYESFSYTERYIHGIELNNTETIDNITMGVKYKQNHIPYDNSEVNEDYDSDSLNLWIQSGADVGDGMRIHIDEMNSKYLGINDIDASTQNGALKAIDSASDALLKVSANRSRIGAQQNRLEHTYKNVTNIAENTQAAESRIRDTDMAKEMVNNSVQNILLQAGVSMMSQANQQTQGVLSLLQ